MKDHREGYWKEWYWNKGGREKVQARRKERKNNEVVFKHQKFM